MKDKNKIFTALMISVAIITAPGVLRSTPEAKPDSFDDMMKRNPGLMIGVYPNAELKTLSQPLKWGDILCVDSNLNIVRVTPESVRENMNRIAEIGGSIIGDPLNRGATILYVGHMRTNYHFTTNFTGTIQVGTNFYSVKDLMK